MSMTVTGVKGLPDCLRFSPSVERLQYVVSRDRRSSRVGVRSGERKERREPWWKVHRDFFPFMGLIERESTLRGTHGEGDPSTCPPSSRPKITVDLRFLDDWSASTGFRKIKVKE